MEKKYVDNEEFTELQERLNEKRRILDVDDGTKVVGWFERIVNVVHTYGIKPIALTFVIVAAFIALLMFANAVDNQNVIERWIAEKGSIHVTGADIRKEINPKVTKIMTRLLYKMDADRVSVLEMHNGKENPTALPFIYCDMTYEETMDNVMYVSEEYVDLNMSKFSFPQYLYEHRYFVGSVDEILSIDKKLGMRLSANGVQYCGIILIRTNIDIGFLMISYLNETSVSREIIIAELSYYVQEIGTYLDYAKQIETREK
jgi:hypothetical protein